MKRNLLLFSLLVLIASHAHAWGMCYDNAGGLRTGIMDKKFGVGLFEHCYFTESFFFPWFFQGTYENNAGKKSLPLTFGGIGLGYDFHEELENSPTKWSNVHPYLFATGNMTLLFKSEPDDSDVGLGFTAAAGLSYFFDRIFLGLELNHNYVAYFDYANDHSQSYLATFGGHY